MTAAPDKLKVRDEMRGVLLDRRRQLLRQVAQVETDLQWLETDVESEQLEAGQEQALAGLLERLDEHDRAEIAAIEQALARIESGEYGTCTACGAPIPLARQRAMPSADCCHACADMREALRRT
jgi:RNA polymerase-binding transcription factor DksA